MQLEAAPDVVPRVLEREVDVAAEPDAQAGIELRPLPPETRGRMDRAVAEEKVRDAAGAERRLNRFDPSELQRKTVAGLDFPSFAIEACQILLGELRDQRRVVPLAEEARAVLFFRATRHRDSAQIERTVQQIELGAIKRSVELIPVRE